LTQTGKKKNLLSVAKKIKKDLKCIVKKTPPPPPPKKKLVALHSYHMVITPLARTATPGIPKD